jgi:hypothetical protein
VEEVITAFEDGVLLNVVNAPEQQPDHQVARSGAAR